MQPETHLMPPLEKMSFAVPSTLFLMTLLSEPAWACSWVRITSSGCRVKLTTAPEADPDAEKTLNVRSLLYCWHDAGT